VSKALPLLFVSAVLAGCVSQRTTAVSDTTGWRGKTVAVTARPPAGFAAMTGGKALLLGFGPIGGAIAGAGMASAGKSIITENGIEDPAPRLDQDLLKVAGVQYGAVAASIAPVSVDTTDVGKLAQAAVGADLLLDVQCYDRGMMLRGLHHYDVHSSINVRVIDVHAAKLLAEGHCRQTTDKEPNPPTYDELLAEKAARLKAILDTQREACSTKFSTEVLNIRP
jgi:hypothetical protein